jgi:hypothetical protein
MATPEKTITATDAATRVPIIAARLCFHAFRMAWYSTKQSEQVIK